MPAPVKSSSPNHLVNIPSPVKAHGLAKKKRIVRRRGRVPGDIESDDEIEREVATDSESDDVLSSLDSASDSDTEPASEDVVPGHSRAFTPNTSQSPGDRVVHDGETRVNDSFFGSGGNWSEMVAEEKANEPADLPVIDFAELDGQKLPLSSRHKKGKKAVKRPRSTSETATTYPPATGTQTSKETEDIPHVTSASLPPNSSFQRRPSAQTARQAYQQRLDNDPSYVPTVGGFWGHDDRLLDKDLRSLSGWWRGRWQGRGRGNGIFRGQGRGGFFGKHSEGYEDNKNAEQVERPWSHDGFEEMKKKEEQRMLVQQSRSSGSTPQNISGFRGAKRYGSGRSSRDDILPRPSTSSDRTWFSMKPELTWTKQHEGFLYFELDPALKPKQGQGQGIVIKLPGKQPKIARTKPRYFSPKPAQSDKAGTTTFEHEDQNYVVKLPQQFTKGKEVEADYRLETAKIEELPQTWPSLTNTGVVTLETVTAPMLSSQQSHENAAIYPEAHSEASARFQLGQLSVETDKLDRARLAKTEEAIMQNLSIEPPNGPVAELLAENEDRSLQNSTAPLFSPLSNPSPIYGSPYGFQPAPPPGFTLNQHGMAVEVATGRPFYFQAPSMYNPRPVMAAHIHSSLPFVPGHMPQHSTVSPDFIDHSSSHTPPMNRFIDPSTGTPIFSFPRQTSRIEIRAPSDDPEPKSPGKSSQRSGLRTTAVPFAPSRTSSNTSAGGYVPTVPSFEGVSSYAPVDIGDGPTDANGVQYDTSMMGYAHYPQQYYYPDAYGYTLNPYMDLTHVRPYEMYPHPSLDGTGYY